MTNSTICLLLSSLEPAYVDVLVADPGSRIYTLEKYGPKESLEKVVHALSRI